MMADVKSPVSWDSSYDPTAVCFPVNEVWEVSPVEYYRILWS